MKPTSGLIYKILAEAAASQNIGILYEAGNQWEDWSKTLDIIEGRGINRQIQRIYGWLASRYRPGDRIFLIGYSRGAYAVRSLAGVIDRVGLVRSDCATERMVREAYRHYRFDTEAATAARFAAEHCHRDVPIEMIGVFDTVKSLGFRAPFVWKWEEVKHAFHSHELGSERAARVSRACARRKPRGFQTGPLGMSAAASRHRRAGLVPRQPRRRRRPVVGVPRRPALVQYPADLDAGKT